jgi:uncharacterized protein (DUF1501 family)
MLTRRIFLRGSAVVMAGAGAAPGWLARAAANSDASGRKKVLVAIFLRGAADGLNIVVPFGDKNYRELRPTLAVPEPGGSPGVGASFIGGPGGNSAIDLDGFFGLHPQLQPLKDLWDKKQFAIVEATGSPDASRSHFDSQEYVESGTAGKGTGDGWLNRALLPPTPETSPLRALAFGSELPRTLRGDRSAISVPNGQQFGIANQDTAKLLEKMYAASADTRLESTGKDAFAAMRMVQRISNGPYTPSNSAQYAQGGELGLRLQQLARFIKADVGVEAAFTELGGWDHHGNENVALFALLRQLSFAISAFTQDMGDRMEDVVLVTMSEFGRTARENGNQGTDHGHGGLMMVVGGAVNGGKVYGKWPGLAEEQLFEKRDLAVTTDFRDVLGELVRGHLGQKDLTKVFPGYQVGAGLGLLKV